MKINYYDHFSKQVIEVQASAKVVHFIQNERDKNKILNEEEIENLSKKKKEEYYQRDFERDFCSLDEKMENGYQPAIKRTIEMEIEQREREKRYLQSEDYKEFRRKLLQEIKNKMPTMPDYIKKVMYLRFFKEMSISQIGKVLGFTKSTAQSYIARGCKYIKKFLDEDIKYQNKKERRRLEKLQEERLKQEEEKENQERIEIQKIFIKTNTEKKFEKDDE